MTEFPPDNTCERGSHSWEWHVVTRREQAHSRARMFPVRSQTVNISGFTGHTVSVVTAQLGGCGTKAAMNHQGQTDGHGHPPVRLKGTGGSVDVDRELQPANPAQGNTSYIRPFSSFYKNNPKNSYDSRTTIAPPFYKF